VGSALAATRLFSFPRSRKLASSQKRERERWEEKKEREGRNEGGRNKDTLGKRKRVVSLFPLLFFPSSGNDVIHNSRFSTLSSPFAMAAGVEEDLQTRVQVHFDAPSHTGGYNPSSARADTEEEAAAALSDALRVDILAASEEEVVFDLVGADASVANALRRTMIAEVSTMAIEYVFVSCNTSVMNDEVLSHRLGLLPIVAPVEFFQEFEKKSDDLAQDFTDTNTIKFTLDVECSRIRDAEDGEKFVNDKVYSSALKYVPEGIQNNWIEADPTTTPRLGFEDILLVKMRPGQRISLTAFATKNIGREHAKWSPVAPCSYRLLPDIRLQDSSGKPRVVGEDARELKELCPMDVFDVEDLGGVPTAVAARPRNCTMCRECVRGDKWKEKVDLGRIKNHYLFSVESTTVIPAPEIVRRGLDVLVGKCQTLRSEIADMRTHNDEDEE
jgi:DNA-directed RNA polymerases I and III subunit RPAC1